MQPLLSVVIPVYREPYEIGRCLAYLAGCPGIDECEIIVSEGDRGASIVPSTILPVRVVSSPPGRGTQLNAAAAIARGSGLVFLHVDTRPPRAFVRLVTHALADRVAGAFDLQIDSTHPLVRLIGAVGLVRSRLTRIPYGDQVQFIRRDAFAMIGGFPEIPIMEDVALMDRLREAGAKISILRPPAVTSGRRWSREGAAGTTLRNWRVMLAYRSGIRPERLRLRYRPQSDLEVERDHLLVFHRAIRTGAVKTRLAASIAQAGGLAHRTRADRVASELYRAMVRDLEGSVRLRGVRTVWFVDDPHAGEDVPGDSVPQVGNDLWERMDDAFRRACAAGARRVVLIGSDIPGISDRIIRLAFRRLRERDLVLGPSEDGGFYLLGSRADRYVPELLTRARSTPYRPGAALADEAAARGLSVAELPTLRDVDTLDELRAVLADPLVAAPRLRTAWRVARTNPD